MAIVIFVAFQALIAGSIADFIRDFDIQPGSFNELAFWVADAGSKILLALMGVAAVVLACGWLLSGTASVRYWLSRLPLVGAMLRFKGLADWAAVVGGLIEAGTPLPNALALAAETLPAADLRLATRVVARRVRAGHTLADSLSRRREFPRSVIPLLAWGEERNALAPALETVFELFRARLESQVILLRASTPTLLLLCTLVILAAMATTSLIPMLTFLSRIM